MTKPAVKQIAVLMKTPSRNGIVADASLPGAVPVEQLQSARIAGALGLAGVPPRGPVILADGINLGQRDVGFAEPLVQPHRFEQQRQRFLLAALHAIELGQVEIGTRIARLARDPCPLLVHVAFGLMAERRLNRFVPPETHPRNPFWALGLGAGPSSGGHGGRRAAARRLSRHPGLPGHMAEAVRPSRCHGSTRKRRGPMLAELPGGFLNTRVCPGTWRRQSVHRAATAPLENVAAQCWRNCPAAFSTPGSARAHGGGSPSIALPRLHSKTSRPNAGGTARPSCVASSLATSESPGCRHGATPSGEPWRSR